VPPTSPVFLKETSAGRGRFKGKPAKFRRCARNCEAEQSHRTLTAKSGTCLGPSSVSPAGTSRGAWVRLRWAGGSLC